METSEILKFFEGEDKFINVFSSDLLPDDLRKGTGLIANTDPSDQPGEHWVSFYCNNYNEIEYFDSFGLQPLTEDFREFLKRTGKSFQYNNITLQHINSTTCGFYAVLFLKARFDNVSYLNFINLFSNDLIVNDIFSEMYMNTL